MTDSEPSADLQLDKATPSLMTQGSEQWRKPERRTRCAYQIVAHDDRGR